MDKSWIGNKNRFSESYVNGVNSFINFPKQNLAGSHNLICCPCVICHTAYYKSIEEAERDLHINDFSKTYVDWIYHGNTLLIDEDNEDEICNPINGVESGSSSMGDDLDEFIVDMGEAKQLKTGNYNIWQVVRRCGARFIFRLQDIIIIYCC